MAWSASAIFRAFVTDALENTAAFDLGGTPDTFKLALYDNDITPDKDASAANSAYNAGQWATAGNEVSDTTGWAATGRALDNPDITNPTSGVIMFDADDEVGGSCTTGLTNVYGGFVYDDTLTTPVADQGVCYLYFGGGTTVAAGGTLTVVFAANGLFRITV
jgi:hypothetical protein